MAAANVVRGTNDKPAASQARIDAVGALPGFDGQLMTSSRRRSSDARCCRAAVCARPTRRASGTS
jgi:hypothetical protein